MLLHCGESLDCVSGCSEGPNSPLHAKLKLLKNEKGLLIHLLSNMSAASRDFSLVEKNV